MSARPSPVVSASDTAPAARRPVSYASEMPSPLNGFTEPAASPTTNHVGPMFGVTEPPVGSFPPVGGPHDVSGVMPQRAGAVSTNASINTLVLIDFQPGNVDSSPTPPFTAPSPAGKIQPSPGRWLPSRSRRSRWLSIHGSSWNGLVK